VRKGSCKGRVCTRFVRDCHQTLIRQFYGIYQTSSTEYAESFKILINHLVTCSDVVHPLYFLTRFIEGLRGDIQVVVVVQRPVHHQYPVACFQLTPAAVLAWPPPPAVVKTLPPARHHSLVSPSSADDHRGNESTCSSSRANKVQALKIYRRSRGLCFKCEERWGMITLALHQYPCVFWRK
jgi:hypothetical protein